MIMGYLINITRFKLWALRNMSSEEGVSDKKAEGGEWII